jgi:hypothetical protein
MNNSDIAKMFIAAMRVAQNSTYGFPGFDNEPKSPYEDLGSGFELRPIEILGEGGQFVIENREKYSNLYYNGEMVSDEVFRKGGMGGKFKDGYCALIHYVQKEPHSLKELGFDSGTHVIIDESGRTCLSPVNSLDYPSHQGGHVGKLKDTYYDLRTGEPILSVGSNGAISSKRLIILEHRYDWYNKSLPLGVYTINKATCEIVKIDDIK